MTSNSERCEELARPDVEQAAIRVLVVSPFPPSYDSNAILTSHWVKAIAAEHPRTRIKVVADCDGSGHSPSDTPTQVTVLRLWSKTARPEDIAEAVRNQIESFKPMVVHFIFNYFTFGNSVKSLYVLYRLTRLSRSSGAAVLVTLHSILSRPGLRASLDVGSQPILPAQIDRMLGTAWMWLVDKAMGQGAIVVVPTPSARAYLEEHVPPLRNRVVDIPLSVDSPGSNLRKAPCLSESHDRSHKIRLAHIGYIVPYKGLESLIDAAQVLVQRDFEVELLIGGESVFDGRSQPHYLESLRKRIQEAGLESKARILDRFVGYEEIQRLSDDGFVFIFPFVDDGVLGMSHSLLDIASRTSASIVATSVPRISAFLDLPGVTVAARADRLAIAGAILTAANQEVTDGSLRRKAIAMRFSIKRVSEEYYVLYDRISRQLGNAGPLAERGAQHPLTPANLLP